MIEVKGEISLGLWGETGDRMRGKSSLPSFSLFLPFLGEMCCHLLDLLTLPFISAAFPSGSSHPAIHLCCLSIRIFSPCHSSLLPFHQDLLTLQFISAAFPSGSSHTASPMPPNTFLQSSSLPSLSEYMPSLPIMSSHPLVCFLMMRLNWRLIKLN